jgi:peptide/nickel transport system ATP-binding protein
VSVVAVRDLCVELTGSNHDIVDDISFTIEAGEIVGLVGESGSGKTTIGTALLGHARRGARIVRGEVLIDGVNILDLPAEGLRRIRGKVVAYVPQDPTASLNPALPIGKQLSEMFDSHTPELHADERENRILSVMAEVKLPRDTELLRRYPHQLSGGQQQRVAIAMAFILHPKVIVLDEPTTGLDVTTQAHVLRTVRELCASQGVAGLYVTHDLAVIANLAHRVLVAYAGRLVEVANRQALFEHPVHPYTRGLMRTIPVVFERRALDPIPGHAPTPGSRPSGCSFAPRCPEVLPTCVVDTPVVVDVGESQAALCFRAVEMRSRPMPLGAASERAAQRESETVLGIRDLSTFYGERQILFDVSMTLRPRECLALVGESGSGKTTLAQSVIGLLTKWRGEVSYKGQPLAPNARARPSAIRRELQYIFQSPYTSLNPRRSVGEIVGSPLQDFFGLKGRGRQERVERAMANVSLPLHYASRYPDQLSGGERQRVAIARALVCEPEVLICDEVTSALDVSVQASIVQLLERLQEQHDLAILFVTHNLAVVRSIAHRVIVLNQGRVVETGACAEVLSHPRQPYTRALLDDTPTIGHGR